MNVLIEAKKVKKSYGTKTEQNTVLDDISLTITKGEFISVMGPSGSGKSTLLYALSGMDRPNSGSIQFCNEELMKKKEKELSDIRRNKMGFIFQQPTMLKNLNVLDNITLPAMRENSKNAALITQKAKVLMQQMEIEEIAERNITQVSGGQLQRAGICRALINQPDVIFGDEPTGALNSKTASEIMNILSTINQEGTTVVLVTHDPKVAARTEHVLFMKDGNIVGDIRFDSLSKSSIEKRQELLNKEMERIGV